ncbi:MAG TPA: allantoate amidohydrolase [Stellaceae bacterium]|nr:allantoate amidohydrolase [Stellaceae bacterium]
MPRTGLLRLVSGEAKAYGGGPMVGFSGNFGEQILARAKELAAISEDDGALTRLFLSPQHKAANDRVAGWMRDASLSARVDPIGNLVGRYEGETPGLPAVMLGSHLDTVRDAGMYDGMLGVLTAISCVEALARQGRRLPFAIEVIGFADEEGVRFGSAMQGSHAIAGTFDPARLTMQDAAGIAMSTALEEFGLDPTAVSGAARRRQDILAYVELHIEQGPVLERHGLPVGIVTSINGVTRLEVTLLGHAGHAGTVPMDQRQDALAAAAECVLAVEARCRAESGLVGTVGVLHASPGAINVIPGEAHFFVDLRAPEDAPRRAAVEDVQSAIAAIAARRGVTQRSRVVHELAAAPCAPWLMGQIERAVEAEAIVPFRLPSGAGHDGMVIKTIADIGMIFVRCAGGVSHNPAESITAADAEAGARVLLRFLEAFKPEPAHGR